MTAETNLTEGMKALTVHQLKVWPRYFQAILDGDKTFELRHNDRAFQTGDLLRLREWDPEKGLYATDPRHYTGRETLRRVGFLLGGDVFGTYLGTFVVFSLLPISAEVECKVRAQMEATR